MRVFGYMVKTHYNANPSTLPLQKTLWLEPVHYIPVNDLLESRSLHMHPEFGVF